MRDNIPDALITAFERQYDSSWNDPQLRNERMAMRYGWAAAMEAKPCLHQIQEPAPATAMDALREAEAALEVAMARILKADPGHSICVTSEAKALVAVRAALAATPAAEHATLPAELATQAAQPVLPTGWVPCVVTYEGQHPEEVAYGPQIMMDRLKKWLERYFEMKAAAPVVLPEPVPTPCRSMFATQREYADAMAQHRKNWAEIEAERGMLATGGQAQAVDIAELVTGMSVSVDVSTGDDDAGNRYFGTVTVAQEDPHDKHGLTLLVQDAKPNFTPQAQEDARDAGNEWQEISTMPTCDDLIWLYCQETNTTDGPVAPDPSLEQFGWTHWAYANAPSTAAIDRAAIAAAKGE